MDLSKAIDMVEWSELFTTLVRKEVHPIFLRILLFIYREQQCDVKWAGRGSKRFSVSNGVRQGAVSSPILFSIYIEDLSRMLRREGLGCHINDIFLGCFGYADDLMLLSTSKSGLQKMIQTCEQFAKKKNLKFSTNIDPNKSKTKGIIFSKNPVRQVYPVLLNGDPLQWVPSDKHLGNTLQCNNTMQMDCAFKRGKFIGKLNAHSQEFHYVRPEIHVRILNLFTKSFYGSSLWNLLNPNIDPRY